MPSLFQPELNLREKAARAVNRDAIEELCGLLRGRGWVTARALQTLRPRWNERFIRLLARAARPRILSGPGTPGYCLAQEASDEDIRHAGASQLSQGRDMARSGIAYLRIFALRKKTEAETGERKPETGESKMDAARGRGAFPVSGLRSPLSKGVSR